MKKISKSIFYEEFEATYVSPSGVINTFEGFDEYNKAREICSKYFSGEIFNVAPYFFEGYCNPKDDGFVVDVNRREIRVSSHEHLDLCEKFVSECGKRGLEFKLKK